MIDSKEKKNSVKSKSKHQNLTETWNGCWNHHTENLK